MLWLRLLATQLNIDAEGSFWCERLGKFAVLLPREPCSRFLFIKERHYLAELPGYRFYNPREIYAQRISSYDCFTANFDLGS